MQGLDRQKKDQSMNFSIKTTWTFSRINKLMVIPFNDIIISVCFHKTRIMWDGNQPTTKGLAGSSLC